MLLSQWLHIASWESGARTIRVPAAIASRSSRRGPHWRPFLLLAALSRAIFGLVAFLVAQKARSDLFLAAKSRAVAFLPAIQANLVFVVLGQHSRASPGGVAGLLADVALQVGRVPLGAISGQMATFLWIVLYHQHWFKLVKLWTNLAIEALNRISCPRLLLVGTLAGVTSILLTSN